MGKGDNDGVSGGQKIPVSVTKSHGLSDSFKERVISLPVPSEVMNAVDSVISKAGSAEDGDSANEGTAEGGDSANEGVAEGGDSGGAAEDGAVHTIEAVRSVFKNIDQHWKMMFYLMALEYNGAVLGVEVGALSKLSMSVQETKDNHEAQMQYAIGVVASMQKDLSLGAMQEAIGAGKALDETHKTTITSPTEDGGEEKLVTKVERGYTADPATSGTVG